jgi:hypothetical protein
MAQCLFCGVNPSGSHEHTVSDWIYRFWQDHIEEVGNVRLPVSTSLSNAISGLEKTFGGASQVKDFCETCNKGWMSNLENEASALLKPMMFGQSLLNLSPRDRALLARWAFLKVLVVNRVEKTYLIPKSRYEGFYKTRNLESAEVHLMASETADTAVFRLNPVGTSDWGIVSLFGFRGLIRLGHVVLYVLGNEFTRANVESLPFLTTEGLAIQLWPQTFGNTLWPTRSLINDEMIDQMVPPRS